MVQDTLASNLDHTTAQNAYGILTTMECLPLSYIKTKILYRAKLRHSSFFLKLAKAVYDF